MLGVLDLKHEGCGTISGAGVIYRCTYSPDHDWSVLMTERETIPLRVLDDYGAIEVIAKQPYCLRWPREPGGYMCKQERRAPDVRNFGLWREAAAEQPNSRARKETRQECTHHTISTACTPIESLFLHEYRIQIDSLLS